MDLVSFQQELVEFLVLIQHLNPVQLRALCQFVLQNSQFTMEASLGKLAPVLETIKDKQFEKLVALVSTTKPLENDQKTLHRKELEALASQHGMTMETLENTFSLLVSLQHLRAMLQNLSSLQLMKLFEIVPPGPPIQQLQLLQQIQQLFGQLQPDTLENLHRTLEQVIQTAPGTEQDRLAAILRLPAEYFQLYQPLKSLLQLDLDELLKLQESLPKLEPVQILQLLQLLQLQPFDVLELRNLVVGNDSGSLSLSQSISDMSDTSDMAPPPPPRNDKKLSLQIVEQPPEKSVYKRNLKPNPMVMVGGDQKGLNDGNLYVGVSLIRCDTFTEEGKFISGNKPIRLSSGRVITFRKLKITTTSHQQQETLFCLKFELRKYSSEEEYQVLDSVHSNPISVLSHSTQMKPIPATAPSITEVIPGFGPPTGGTRVAVLGSNFVDTPATRIRFDTTDVVPTFHGPGTLICHTPEHKPGTVTVRVCNSNKKWSESTATFTYDASIQPFLNQIPQSTIIPNQNIESGSIGSGPWTYESISRFQQSGQSVNSMDARSFTPLHYASALGNTALCNYLLENGAEVNMQDRYGCTALYWATYFGEESVVQLLVEHGADLNIPNLQGLLPLFLAITLQYDSIAVYLMESGAALNIPTGDSLCSLLHVSAAMSSPSTLNTLIKLGAHLNAQDEEGDVPLHWAIREGDLARLEVLLNYSQFVSLDARNEDFETPLHLACQIEDKNTVQILLQRGANVNVVDIQGSTPLHDACFAGNVDLVQILLQKGARSDIQDKEGKIPAQCVRGPHAQRIREMLAQADSASGENQSTFQGGTYPFAKVSPFSPEFYLVEGDAMAMEWNPPFGHHTVPQLNAPHVYQTGRSAALASGFFAVGPHVIV